MSTNITSCEHFNDHLMAFLEHDVDDATRAAMERHAVSCAECGAETDYRKPRYDSLSCPIERQRADKDKQSRRPGRDPET